MTLQTYMNDEENLPDFITDFHDQKDLFKAIYDQYSEGNNKELLSTISCEDAQCFTIDVFLWWMGIHGYKLQKSKKKGVDFLDAHQTINHYKKLRQQKGFDLLLGHLKEICEKITKLDFNKKSRLTKIPILISEDNECGKGWRAEIADNYEEYKPTKICDINFEDISFHFIHSIQEKQEGRYLFHTKKDAIECARFVNKTYLNNKAKIYI